MAEIERFVRELDVKPTCECASRKCGTHRCRASIWWRGVTLGLAVYILVMHSFHISKLDEISGTFATEVRERAKVEAAMTTQSIIEQWRDAGEATRKALTDAMDQRLRTATDLLHRAEDLNWVLATPEIERDLQLKAAIEALHPE